MHNFAARLLGVVCVLAMGLGVLYITTHRPSPVAAIAAVPRAVQSTPPPTPVPSTPVSPTPVPPAAPAGRAAAAVAAAEAAAAPTTQLGVVVLDRTTDETAVGDRGEEPFYTASEAKTVLVVDMLDRRRVDGLAIDAAALDLVRRALSQSDDNAMNALWTRFDGPGAAGRVAKRLGLKGTSNPKDTSQWGEMNVSAGDTVRIWQYVLETMPAADRELMMSDLRAATPNGKDGFDQSFGLLDPDVRGPRSTVAKQGWMCCFSGQYYLHSAGSVGSDQRYLVAVLTRIPRKQGWEPARQEVDRIVRAAVQALP